MILGDWEDVQVDLGLLPERITPRPSLDVLGRMGITLRRAKPPIPSAGGAARARKGDKRRKAEKQARKRNRRK